MKINEIISCNFPYVVSLKFKKRNVIRMLIFAFNIAEARQIAYDIWDTKNVLSINSFSSIQSENVTQKQHHRTFKLVSPETRHQQYQRILSKKYVKALQFPPITRDDKLIALKNASTYLKRLKLINAQKNRSKFKK